MITSIMVHGAASVSVPKSDPVFGNANSVQLKIHTKKGACVEVVIFNLPAHVAQALADGIRAAAAAQLPVEGAA